MDYVIILMQFKIIYINLPKQINFIINKMSSTKLCRKYLKYIN